MIMTVTMKVVGLLVLGATAGALVTVLVLRGNTIGDTGPGGTTVLENAITKQEQDGGDWPNVQGNVESLHAGEDALRSVSPSTPSLDLSNQGLTRVPDEVFTKTDLVVLNLSNNALEGALQAEVRQLQNLKVLDLSDNEFTGVPAEVGQLAKLEVLDLSNNNLSGLPYELGNLKNLKTLNLSGNANIAEQDLARIRQGLSPSVNILQ